MSRSIYYATWRKHYHKAKRLIWYADKLNKLSKFLIRIAKYLIDLGTSLGKYNSKIIKDADYHAKQSDIYRSLSSNK